MSKTQKAAVRLGALLLSVLLAISLCTPLAEVYAELLDDEDASIQGVENEQEESGQESATTDSVDQPEETDSGEKETTVPTGEEETTAPTGEAETETPEMELSAGEAEAQETETGTVESEMTAWRKTESMMAVMKESKSEQMPENLADAAAQIGEEKYATLKEAVDAAQSGDTIELLKTVTSDGNITIAGKALTITGNALERAAGDTAVNLITVAGDASLTLRAITVDGKELSAKVPLIRVEEGGALTLESGAVLQNSKVEPWDTPATNWGGAVLTYGTLTMNGDSCIQNNSAFYGGGVVVWNNGSLIMNDSSCIRNNNATLGGGVRSYFDDMTRYYDRSSAGSTIVMNGNASIYGNYAKNEGGGIDSQVGTLTMNGASSITGNSTGYMGGGVHNQSFSKFTMNDNASITNNSSVSLGGGISNVAGSSAANGAPQVTADEPMAGYLVMNGNSSVSNNTANSGGGVYNHQVLSNYEGTFGAVMTMNDNSTVAENTATGGGGVLIGERFTMNGGTIVNNSASFGGGAYYSYLQTGHNAEVVINQGEICNNQAAKAGGGLYLCYGVNMVMRGGSIHHNEAATNGGGIYIGGSSSRPSTLTIEGGSICCNSAENQGGGIYSVTDSVLFKNGTITDNVAGKGGGLCNLWAEFVMEGGELYNNHALTMGDDLYSSKSAVGTSYSYISTITLPDISQKGWMLDGDHEDPDITECAHAINGWYYDGAGGDEETSALRWNVVNTATGESCNEKNEDNAEHWEEYTTFTTYEGEVALKAAHDRLVPYKVAHRYTYRIYDVNGTLLTEEVRTVTEETVRYGVRGTTILADAIEREPEYEGQTYSSDGASDPILLEMEDTGKTVTLYYLLEERLQPEVPDEPDEPDTPDEPKVPDEPTPDEPSVPDEPTPDVPGEPGTPTKTYTPHKTSKTPKTGDQSNIGVWVAVLAVSGGAAATGVVLTRRKRKK